MVLSGGLATGDAHNMKIGPRSAKEILESYDEFNREVVEGFYRNIRAASADRKSSQMDIGKLMAEFGGTMNSKTLETWVEIAAQLAELNQHLRDSHKPAS
jgi:hypothetical protein